MWPRTVARLSKPVRSSISFSSSKAIPPRRAWPKESTVSAAVAASPPSARVAPSATTTIEKFLPVVSWRWREVVADLLDVERALGHEDDVGAAGEAGVARDPARVAAHDLADDDAVVRLGRRVQAVDRLGRDLHRGLKAEREVGRVEVVVDRLRHADGREAGRRTACARRRACRRRRSGSARRSRAPSATRARAPRRSRSCRRSCARCRGSSRPGAGCRSCSRASARWRRSRARPSSRCESRTARGRRCRSPCERFRG